MSREELVRKTKEELDKLTLPSRKITHKEVRKLKEEIRNLFEGKYRCPVCGKKMKNGGRDRDSDSWEHLIPVKLVESSEFDIDVNDFNNMTYMCYSCNSSKNARSMIVFLEEIKGLNCS